MPARSALCLVTIILACAGAPGWAQDSPDPFISCSFYPQGPGCEAVYRRALKENSPVAVSVRGAFEGYARYLKHQNAGLTEGDRRYLRDYDIRLPFELNRQNLAGLHNVINDPALKGGQVRRAAVNRFVAHAVQAELYCGTQKCAPAES